MEYLIIGSSRLNIAVQHVESVYDTIHRQDAKNPIMRQTAARPHGLNIRWSTGIAALMPDLEKNMGNHWWHGNPETTRMRP